MFPVISLVGWRTDAADADRKKWQRQWWAPKAARRARRKYGARHRPKQVRAGGAPKGPQTHVNVSRHFIGRMADGRGRRGPQKMAAPMVGPPGWQSGPPEIRSPPPSKTGACWGCPKGATNACECFPSFHWSDGGRKRPTRTAKSGSANGGPPKQRTGPAENTEPATVQNRCVLGVPQRGHKRL